jgi:hypothetical protein
MSVIDRFEVAVTYDPARGYVASHPELPSVVALSLRGLRHRLRCRHRAKLRAKLRGLAGHLPVAILCGS